MTGEQYKQAWNEETGSFTLSSSDELGSGGEGTVYNLPDHPELVAKIYHQDKRTRRTFRKLEVMIEYFPVKGDPDSGHLYVAWPQGIIYDGHGGEAVGFLMPRVEKKNSLLDYYNPRVRSLNAPQVNYRDLCSTARSLATALAELNGRGYVVGDINESNAHITDDEHVTLIDADSFQVRDHGVSPADVYHCLVGKPDYTPPELQGANFEVEERNVNHDRFALAVVIYQILMEGGHPFSGVYEGEGEPPQREDSISEGYFLYSQSRMVPLESLPRDRILWESLDDRLRSLFTRCFDEGHSVPESRPSPREWADALDETARSLSTCDSNPNHLYAARPASETENFAGSPCPWCARRDLTGLDSFPPPETSEVLPKSTPRPRPTDTQPSPGSETQTQAPGPQPTAAGSAAGLSRFPIRITAIVALALVVLIIGICATGSGESGGGVSSAGSANQITPQPPALGGASAPVAIPTDTPTPVATIAPKMPNTPIAAAIVPTNTPIPTGTQTHTPKPTDTPTPRPTFTHSPTLTPTHTVSPTPSQTPLPTFTSTPSATSTPTPLPTATVTATPLPTETPLPCTAFLPGADLRKCDLSGKDLRGLNLGGADLSFAILSGADMTRSDLSGSKLTEADLTDAKLERAMLTNASISGASIKGADFTKVDLSSADISDIQSFDGATLIETVFPADAELVGVTFVAADLTRGSLVGANLEKADFTRAILYRTDLSQTVLTETTFRGANLDGTRLDGANLQGAHLVGVELGKIYFDIKPDFRGADLQSADLSGAGLDGVDFTGADLEEARFNRAEMRSTIFTDTDLRDARMRDADLQGALFNGADVSDADFTGSNLSGASFQDADVEDTKFVEADLTNASFRSAENIDKAIFEETICPDSIKSNDCYEERRLRGASP